LPIRVYQLAKELKLQSKEILEACKRLEISVKNHMSSLSQKEVERVRAALSPPPGPPAAGPVKKRPSRKKKPVKKALPEVKKKGAAEPKKGAEKKTLEKVVIEEEAHVVRPQTPVVLAEKERRPSYEPGEKPEKAAKPKKRFVAKAAEKPAPAGVRRRRRLRKVKRPKPVLEKPTSVSLQLPVTVKELSSKLGIKANFLIKHFMQKGILATINQSIADEELIYEVAIEHGIDLELKRETDIEEELLKRPQDKPEDLKPRAPVVTFLGHVDHGKTSLLDRIRKTNVIASEAGGITQHIGASRIDFNGKRVVFLDTPGHRAFTEMRARGANVTDLVALVVAADDGVMPQTEEAIDHARAAGVPILVAINKIDKPEANVLRVKQQLATLGLTPEEWGGDVIFVEVSAVTGEGIDELLEMLTLQAEVLELKANPDKPAAGTVLESRLSEGKGPVATVLIQEGTLHKEDVILCGHAFGRARSLLDDRANPLKSASPSTPVQITGLSELPETGAKLYVMKDLQEAKRIAEQRRKNMWASSLAATRKHLTLDSLYESIRQGKVKKLNVVVKADTKGSLEVLTKSMEEISTEEVQVDILHKGVGGINESDVDLADASDAIVIGFHVVPEEGARRLAEKKGVEVNLYQVIYQVTDEIRAALEHRLEPEKREVILGHMTVRKVFKISRIGTVAGCYVTEGRIPRGAMARVIRQNVVIYTGRIESLRRFKEDVGEAKEGFECGARIENYNDFKVDDDIEAFTIEEIARKLQ